MFLEQYCEKQKGAGYTIVKDPILTFYQAMSVGIDWNLGFDINDLDFLQGSPLHIGLIFFVRLEFGFHLKF